MCFSSLSLALHSMPKQSARSQIDGSHFGAQWPIDSNALLLCVWMMSEGWFCLTVYPCWLFLADRWSLHLLCDFNDDVSYWLGLCFILSYFPSNVGIWFGSAYIFLCVWHVPGILLSAIVTFDGNLTLCFFYYTHGCDFPLYCYYFEDDFRYAFLSLSHGEFTLLCY